MGTAIAYYEMVDRLKETLESDVSINTVSYGNIYDAANNKTTMWPLAHFIVNNTELRDRTYRFNMTLSVLDLIDHSNENAVDKFRGNDNIMDIHNTQLSVITEAMLLFRRKELRDLGYVLVGTPKFEAFTHSFDKDTAGWFCDFTVEVIMRMNVGC